METLQVGQTAPEFTLRDVDDQAHALNAKASPLTLAIFFKTTCPTCRYAWQYYQRLYETFSSAGLRVLGISQHNTAKTRDYRNQYNATFPHLVDDEFLASRQYDPAFVPTGFLIDSQGIIVETFQSWNRQNLNELAGRIANELGVPIQEIVTPHDHAVENKIG